MAETTPVEVRDSEAGAQSRAEHSAMPLSRRASLLGLVTCFCLAVGVPFLPWRWICDVCGVQDERGAGVVYAVGNAIIMLVAAALLLNTQRAPWRSLGLSRADIDRQLLRAVGVALAAHALNAFRLLIAVVPLLGEVFGEEPPAFSAARVQHELVTAPEVANMLVLYGLTAISEELLFRGLILRYLRQLAGDAWTAILEPIPKPGHL